MKILLVDDSRTMRNIQKNVLAQLGYTDILEANDGVEALAQLAGTTPDLMLVDWNMPNMDGLTLVTKVRAQNTTLPIIMVTTEGEKSRVIEALKAGVDSYVLKPFTPQMLSERIAQTMAKRGVTAQ